MQYMGSKNRYAKYIVPIIQSYIDENNIAKYLEPFVGGANIIDKVRWEKKIGCDSNEYLIALLQYVSNQNEMPLEIDENEYNEVKNNKENYDKWYVGLVGFTATFGNKFFGGCARNKTKSTADYSRTAINNIRKQQPNLKSAYFISKSFQDIPTEKLNDYVIYCDPPYRDTTTYKTRPFPYEEYYDWVRELSKNNIVLCSEYWMPDDFECIWSKETTTQIDSNRKAGDSKNIRIEKLFKWKGKEN